MNLKSLHEKALSLSKTYRESESGLLDVLMDLRKDNGFYRLGYPSLFVYCVSALSLSEAQACYFSKVAKKSEEVPELKAAIEQGVISLSQARRVVAVITKESASDWIAKAALLPQRELEREVCAVNPKALPKERLRVISENRSELKVGVSCELEKKIRRVREILGPHVSLEMMLDSMATLFLKHKDPIEKAKRVKPKVPVTVPVQSTASPKVSSGRLSERTIPGRLPNAVLHEVNRRDAGKCQALLPNGQVCQTRTWVQIHHLKPRAHGGPNTPENLVTLCSAHHRFAHTTGLNHLRLTSAQVPR